METARSNRLIELPHPRADKFLEFLASLPSVTYEVDQDFLTTTVSSNVFNLLGIEHEALLGTQALWHERLFAADRDRLTTRLNDMAPGAFASEIHKITNDRGLPVWVSHGFWKVNTGNHTSVRGSMVPLTPEVSTKFVETDVISQFIHKIGNHFQLISLLIGSVRRNRIAGGDLDALEESVQRAVEFTHAFSNFCQIPVRSSPVDLGEILASASQSVAPLFAERSVLFNVSGDRALSGTFILGDACLLELAFTSLLKNAFDATKPGDVVTVESKCEAPRATPTSIAWISITDTGCGMPKGIMEKASAPFFTCKRDRNGLGLTTAIRVFEMHGGLMNIASEENRGTRVDIVLPICGTVIASER